MGTTPPPRPKTLKEAAAAIGVSSITLRRWLLENKVPEVARDRNGWRVFSAADLRQLKAFARRRTPPAKR